MKRILQVFLMVLIFASTSCRLGEFFRKADPETQAEIEREESIPQNENLDNNRQESGNE